MIKWEKEEDRATDIHRNNARNSIYCLKCVPFRTKDWPSWLNTTLANYTNQNYSLHLQLSLLHSQLSVKVQIKNSYDCCEYINMNSKRSNDTNLPHQQDFFADFSLISSSTAKASAISCHHKWRSCPPLSPKRLPCTTKVWKELICICLNSSQCHEILS